MELKILHTGDLHIGMRFSSYPDGIRQNLIDARINVLEKIVNIANDNHCDILIIAGDLFDRIVKIPKKDIILVIEHLDKFEGECVLILPGNHDFDNGMTDLWDLFSKNTTQKICLLNKEECFILKKFGLDVAIYPAFCNAKHSKDNNLTWIEQIERSTDVKWHIGIAHGALEGYSPDLENRYFNMTVDELKQLNLDLWCLGHMHFPFFKQEQIQGINIFNAGTPEPDGMDCKHGGSVWLISMDENKNISSKAIDTGKFRFFDLEYKISNEEDFNNIINHIISDDYSNKIVRLKLWGRIDKDLFDRRQIFYDRLRKNLTYLKLEDEDLLIKITADIIDQEFTKGSFPYKLLKKLSDSGDNEALELAYEIIMEVKE